MQAPTMQREFAGVTLPHPRSSVTGDLVLGVAMLGPAVDFEEVGPSGMLTGPQGTDLGACLAFLSTLFFVKDKPGLSSA